MKLAEIASATHSTIEQGEPELEITSTAGLDIAGPGDITFLANPKYSSQIKGTKASAIFLNEGFKIDRTDIAVLRAKDSYLAYTRAMRLFFPPNEINPFIHPTAVIHETAAIANSVEIHANVVIQANCNIASGVRIMPNVTVYPNVSIGENSIIHSGVSILANCEIGQRCIIQNNATIGSDGFGYARDEEERWLKIPQTGRVVLEDDVEIGANTAIDCASVGETRIKRGAKIDNLVQIGHSCTVDEDALICAQTGLAGSSHIGKRVILTGQVGIAGHLKIGDDAVLTAKSATSHDIEPGKIMSGIPAFENKEWLRSTAAFRKLGEIAQRLRKLEKQVFGGVTSLNFMEKVLSESGYDITPLNAETIERLAQDLNEEEYRILLDHGTEPAFCGTLLDNKMDGTYACRLCGLPLFSSSHKFNSGTGWPSFYRPFDKDHLTNIEDNSCGMRRVEIRCARCGGHQGHVFPDGPPPTGQRYCLNSASLEFFGDGENIPQKS